MNKKSVLWVLLDLVFLIVFNTVFFVVGGTSHAPSVWIAYGFIHFSYLMVLATPFLIRKGKSSAVFGFSIYSISSAYFFVEFIVGVFFILIKPDSYKTSLVVQIVIAGIYAVILLALLLANEHTADSEERQEAEVAYIKEAASKVKLLVGKLSDKKANKEIEKAYDVLHGSPTKSDNSVKDIEASIKSKIGELENAVSAQDTQKAQAVASAVISLVQERNQKLRQLN